MLKKFLESRAEKRRLFRCLLSDTLVRMLDEQGELIVDRRLLTQLGATRRELFRVAYSLAIKERLHVLSGADGFVHLYTNARFVETIHNDAGIAVTEVEPTRDTESIEMPLSVTDPDSEVLILEDTIVIDPIPEEPAAKRQGTVHMSKPARESDDWADFVVGTGRESREKASERRKNLPSRERDPWPAFDVVDLPPLDVTKKK